MKKLNKFIIILSIISMFPVQSIFAQSITEGEKQVLRMALQDEYKAKATYEIVIEKFGNIRPFSNIVRAEQRHIEALLYLFDLYQVPVPDNEWEAIDVDFSSVKDACEAAVEAEVENADLYDELFEKVEKEDIRSVFENLQSASINRHLRAFQRCAEFSSI